MMHRRHFFKLASSGLLVAAAEPMRRFWQVPRAYPGGVGLSRLDAALAQSSRDAAYLKAEFERLMRERFEEYDRQQPPKVPSFADVKNGVHQVVDNLLADQAMYVPHVVVVAPEPCSRRLPDIKFTAQLVGRLGAPIEIKGILV